MRCYARLVGRRAHPVRARADAPAVVVLVAVVTTVPIGIAKALVEYGTTVARDARLPTGATPLLGSGRNPGRHCRRPASRSGGTVGRGHRLPELQAQYAFYAKRAGAASSLDTRKLFATVCTISGADGWFYADTLWNIRRRSLRRGRACGARDAAPHCAWACGRFMARGALEPDRRLRS
jgi:hypothetical protein